MLDRRDDGLGLFRWLVWAFLLAAAAILISCLIWECIYG